MKKVIIFEIYGHHIFIITISAIFKLLGYDITICTTRNIYEDIKYDLLEQKIKPVYIIKEYNEGFLKFIIRVNKYIVLNNFDLFVINTIQGWAMLKYLFIRKNAKTISANGRLSEWFNVSFFPKNRNSLRNIIYHYYSWILSRWYLFILDGMIFHTDKAIETAVKHKYKKPIIKLPYSFASNYERDTNNNGKRKFVLTGSMNPLSRDYYGFFSTLLYKKSIAKENTEFYILSKIPKNKYGYKCLDMICKLRSKGFNIITYDSWISEYHYKKVINSADFLIALINYEKYYNTGELTSTLVDAIRYSKPAIYPAGYIPDKAMSGCSIFYNDFEDLVEIIDEIECNYMSFQKYVVNAMNYSEINRIVNFENNFQNFLEKI